jgi:hypothetical protein
MTKPYAFNVSLRSNMRLQFPLNVVTCVSPLHNVSEVRQVSTRCSAERRLFLQDRRVRHVNRVGKVVHRITVFLDFSHRPVFLGVETRRFGNWICFRPQVNGEKTPTQ